MKSYIVNFFLSFIIMLINILIYYSIKIENVSNNSNNISSIINCRICMELFLVDFNYNNYLNNKQLLLNVNNFIKNYKEKYETLFIKKQKFNNNTIDHKAISKDLALNFFLKSEELNLNNKLESCKYEKFDPTTNKLSICIKYKIDSCNSILYLKSNECYNMLYNITEQNNIEIDSYVPLNNTINIFNDNINNKLEKTNQQSSLNIYNTLKNMNKLKQKSNINTDRYADFILNNKANINNNNINNLNYNNELNKEKNNLLNLSRLVSYYSNSFLKSNVPNIQNHNNNYNSNFNLIKQIPPNYYLNKSNINNKKFFKDDINNVLQYNNISKNNINYKNNISSLLELSPEINLKSNNSNYEKLKSDADFYVNSNNSWKPNKPILFDNFQDNLGSQLKEISFLTK